jgi:hypothetical protein
VVGIVAAAGALLIAGGVAAWLLARPASAEEVADQYLRALADGDAAAIRSLHADDEALSEQTEAIFAGATAYITDYSVALAAESDAVRTARANVQLDGDPAVIVFTLTQRDGRWTIGDDSVASLQVDTSIGDSVRVGGVLVPASTELPVLPAVYPVTAAPEEFVRGEALVIVTGEAPVAVAIDASLTPEAAGLAQGRLDAYADSCTLPATAVPDSCGVRVPWAADLAALSSIAFRIDAYPALALAPDGRSFAATGGHLVATATGTTRAGQEASFTYRADDWALRGSVSFEGDQMVLEVR